MAILEIANEWFNIATIKHQGGDARYKLVGVAPAIKGFAQVLPGVDEVKRVLESIGQGETCVNRVGLGLNTMYSLPAPMGSFPHAVITMAKVVASTSERNKPI